MLRKINIILHIDTNINIILKYYQDVSCNSRDRKGEFIMAYKGFAIDNYLDAEKVTKELDELIKKPVHSIKKEYLDEYIEEYFNKKCTKSKEMIDEAKNIIPGGVQHNLAFNYPFPIVITKAEGAK